MRKKIVAGNWKMNCSLRETQSLLKEIKKGLVKKQGNTTVMIAPTFTNLYPAHQIIKDTPVKLVAQNMHQAEKGAFTGEISGGMLKSVGVEAVILGHSERRKYFNETSQLLRDKVQAALQQELKVIFCIGENLAQREAGEHFKVIEDQIKNSLFNLTENEFKEITLAYEPIWAIGTGKTATANQAQEIHAFIRGLLEKKYSEELADNTAILYGGSVKPHNAPDLFKEKDIDGGLIGGAALKSKDFLAIIAASEQFNFF